MFRHLIIAFGLAGLIFVGYLLWTILSAWFTVKALPREEMFICYKHGPIHKSNVVHFNSGDGGDYTDYCSICFHERLSQAEKVN